MTNNTIIFGDSYSTFEGYIPDGYAAYYRAAEMPQTDVTKVTETWWHQVVNEAGLNLVLNNSWSGSTIGYTGYHNTDCSETSSFIYRLTNLIQEGFFEQHRIDTVFVFGGTNDSCANAPLGSMQYENWTKDDLYAVLPAICYFFQLLRGTLPNANIYCLINTQLKPEVTEALKTVSETYGMTAISFDRIDKQSGHPTIEGMLDIKNAVLSVLNGN